MAIAEGLQTFPARLVNRYYLLHCGTESPRLPLLNFK
jgi:hypothetical protein